LTLTGDLEDLPLLDILQVVSFSKRTGWLTIRTAAGEGAVVFKDGLVVSCFTWDSGPVDPATRSLPPAERAALIRRRIEEALAQLIRLHEGQFGFSLAEDIPAFVDAHDITDETLRVGINPQELLLALTKGLDEDRRDSTAAVEVSFAEPEPEALLAAAPSDAEDLEAEGLEAEGLEAEPPEEAVEAVEPEETVEPEPPEETVEPEPPAPPPAPSAAAEEIRVILLVDDEDEVRRVLGESFTRAGYQVVEAGDPDTAVKKAGKLGKGGVEFLLVTDLGMPTSGGSSFQGGFEVVKRLWKMKLHPRVLMMAETLGPALQARAKQMGISSFVFKPGLSKLDPEQFRSDLSAFAAKMVSDVLPRATRAAPAAAATPAPAPARPQAPPASAEEMSRQFAMLQRRLEELRRPSDPSDISHLVMTVAREFFERAILFLVKGEEVRGLGGFGTAPRGESLDLAARDIVIPLSEPSVFQQVAAARRPFAGPFPEGKWTQFLMGRIGRYKSASVAVLPLLAHRETIALLFGDNPDTGRDLGRLDALELFVSQAGVALENAFLQRKLQAAQKRE
jgi:CheY-like chemotaxis protein